ncbi:MAG: DNA polymerase IV [Candidatus Bathyarchaeia archaeon]
MDTVRSRIILHIDMDQFFAAVEEREHPEIRGKPVVIGADPKGGKGRGVVSACNYEARKCGVSSGMPITAAWRLCPHAVYLPVNYRLYAEVSSRIMEILRGYAEKLEQWGLDEAFLDVSTRVRTYEDAKRLAQEIKREIYEKEGLTCSIGIGPNKLVAKIASDFKKPDGLTVVEEEDVQSFLAPLPVGKLLWVGKKTERKLNGLGIKTVGDLKRCDPSLLVDKFGVVGTQLYLSARGIDQSEVEERGISKSIGRYVTFEEDTSDFHFIFSTLDKLCEEVHTETKDQNLLFKTVTVTVRYEDFETHTHTKTLLFQTNRLADLLKVAHELIQPYLRAERKVRLIGVRVSNLFSHEKQKTLI